MIIDRFKAARDQGIEGKVNTPVVGNTIVQVKHWFNAEI